MKNSYRAMQVTRPGWLELVERRRPEPGPGQVLLEVQACGMCSADANEGPTSTIARWLRLSILFGCVSAGVVQAQTPMPKIMSAGDSTVTIHAGELDRRYTVHVPPAYDGRTPVAVVVMLHGGGGTGKGAATETAWSAKADEAGFLAIFPEAMPPDPGQASNFRRNPQLWNDGSERFFSHQKAPDDIAFLNAMLDDLRVRFTVDDRRIFVTGFSNGASMSFRVGAELSKRIAAIAPVAGASWLNPLAPERPVPMMYITGTADPLNLIEGGVPRLATGGSDNVRAKPKPPVRDSIMAWTKALGCPATPRETSDVNGVRTETYGPGRDGAEVVYVTVEGLGHVWPGGRTLLPEFMVGKRSDKLKATDVIWEFFQRHARR